MLEFNSRNIKTWAKLGSCGSFGIAALKLPELYNDVVILTSDLTFYSGLERFKKKYSEKLYNIGIAEQNMIGIAAGMAKEGLNPFATTYAAFATTRSCDQVRVNMGYMKLGIKLVGLSSGLSAGILGATHMSFDDIAIMRAIPNITILSPADCTETIKATFAAAEHDGPVYLRLTGIMNNPIVYKEDYEYKIGNAITLKEGLDIAIIATGTMVNNSLEAANIIEEEGVSCSVINMHTIKPLDISAIKKATSAKLIVTVEEHSVNGGLGGAIAEYLSKFNKRPPHQIIGISDEFKHAGDYNYLLHQYGLESQQIASKIINRYKEVN
ncbi:transketolase C-terminal domain-containing protein [Clostridium sp. SM-530-WT-3G]|uniref:transketolase family protein n=1 Tax=Clostridium sp. SM-530-WT-3G TaxID=2725303 RepID=UPI00145C3DC0|nr:transketolase C-terminal domain-containing protein [Clostridium sp. SM-530-WT-3G]NME82782.1 transketolase [Clostridium sp. SM-530-WT-3G]